MSDVTVKVGIETELDAGSFVKSQRAVKALNEELLSLRDSLRNISDASDSKTLLTNIEKAETALKESQKKLTKVESFAKSGTDNRVALLEKRISDIEKMQASGFVVPGGAGKVNKAKKQIEDSYIKYNTESVRKELAEVSNVLANARKTMTSGNSELGKTMAEFTEGQKKVRVAVQKTANLLNERVKTPYTHKNTEYDSLTFTNKQSIGSGQVPPGRNWSQMNAYDVKRRASHTTDGGHAPMVWVDKNYKVPPQYNRDIAYADTYKQLSAYVRVASLFNQLSSVDRTAIMKGTGSFSNAFTTLPADLRKEIQAFTADMVKTARAEVSAARESKSPITRQAYSTILSEEKAINLADYHEARKAEVEREKKAKEDLFSTYSSLNISSAGSVAGRTRRVIRDELPELIDKFSSGTSSLTDADVRAGIEKARHALQLFTYLTGFDTATLLKQLDRFSVTDPRKLATDVRNLGSNFENVFSTWENLVVSRKRGNLLNNKTLFKNLISGGYFSPDFYSSEDYQNALQGGIIPVNQAMREAAARTKMEEMEQDASMRARLAAEEVNELEANRRAKLTTKEGRAAWSEEMLAYDLEKEASASKQQKVDRQVQEYISERVASSVPESIKLFVSGLGQSFDSILPLINEKINAFSKGGSIASSNYLSSYEDEKGLLRSDIEFGAQNIDVQALSSYVGRIVGVAFAEMLQKNFAGKNAQKFIDQYAESSIREYETTTGKRLSKEDRASYKEDIASDIKQDLALSPAELASYLKGESSLGVSQTLKSVINYLTDTSMSSGVSLNTFKRGAEDRTINRLSLDSSLEAESSHIYQQELDETSDAFTLLANKLKMSAQELLEVLRLYGEKGLSENATEADRNAAISDMSNSILSMVSDAKKTASIGKSTSGDFSDVIQALNLGESDTDEALKDMAHLLSSRIIEDERLVLEYSSEQIASETSVALEQAEKELSASVVEKAERKFKAWELPRSTAKDIELSRKRAFAMADTDYIAMFGDNPQGRAVGGKLLSLQSALLAINDARLNKDDVQYEQSVVNAYKEASSLFSSGGYREASRALSGKLLNAIDLGNKEEAAQIYVQLKQISTLLSQREALLSALRQELQKFYYYKETPNKPSSVNGLLDNKNTQESTWTRYHLANKNERQEILNNSQLDFLHLMEIMGFTTYGYKGLQSFAPSSFEAVARNLGASAYDASLYKKPIIQPEVAQVISQEFVDKFKLPKYRDSSGEKERDWATVFNEAVVSKDWSRVRELQGVLESSSLQTFQQDISKMAAALGVASSVTKKLTEDEKQLLKARGEEQKANDKARQVLAEAVSQPESVYEKLSELQLANSRIKFNGNLTESERENLLQANLAEQKALRDINKKEYGLSKIYDPDMLPSLFADLARSDARLAEFDAAISKIQYGADARNLDTALQLFNKYAASDEARAYGKHAEYVYRNFSSYNPSEYASLLSEKELSVYNDRLERRDAGDEGYSGLTDVDILLGTINSFLLRYMHDASDQLKSYYDEISAEKLAALKSTSVVGLNSMLDSIRTGLDPIFRMTAEERKGQFPIGAYDAGMATLAEAAYLPIIKQYPEAERAYTNFKSVYMSGAESGYSSDWLDSTLSAFKEFESKVLFLINTAGAQVVAAEQKKLDVVTESEQKQIDVVTETETSKVESAVASTDTSGKKGRKPSSGRVSGRKGGVKVQKQTEEVVAGPTEMDDATTVVAPVSPVVKGDWATEKTLTDVREDLGLFLEAVSGKEVNYFMEQAARNERSERVFSTEGLSQINNLSKEFPELIPAFSRIKTDAAEDVIAMEEQAKQLASTMGLTIDQFVHHAETGTGQIAFVVHKGAQEAKLTVKQIGKDIKVSVDDVGKHIKGQSERTFASVQSIAFLLSSALRGITFKQLVSAAGAAEKALKSLQATTGKYAKEALSMVDTLNESYGMAKTQAAQALTYAYNQISEVGISNNQALQMSNALVQLGADYSAYYGGAKSAMEVTQALTQVMLGSYRAARQYGIAISSTDVEQLALAYGKQASELSEAEKMMYRYQIIMDRASNVMGEYERTAGTYFNAQQELNKAWADAKVALGDGLLPYATILLHILTDLSNSIGAGGLGGNIVILVAALATLATAFQRLSHVLRTTTGMGRKWASWITIAVSAFTALVLWIESSAEKHRKAIIAETEHKEAMDELTKSTEQYTMAVSAASKEAAKARLSAALGTWGVAYSEQFTRLSDAKAALEKNKTASTLNPKDVATARVNPGSVFAAGSKIATEGKNVEDYQKQVDASLSSVLSAAQAVLSDTGSVDSAVDYIQKALMPSFTSGEMSLASYRYAIKYVREHLDITEAIAEHIKSVVSYASKLETAEKNLVSIKQKEYEAQNQLLAAYEIEQQYIDEIYDKESKTAKEAATGNTNLILTQAKEAITERIKNAESDEDKAKLSSEYKDLLNADVNAIEVDVTNTLMSDDFKGTQDEIDTLIKMISDKYKLAEGQAALIVQAYREVWNREQLYYKESEKALREYIAKQDVSLSELKKSEYEAVAGDIYQSMDARKQAYEDLRDLQEEELNTSYANQIALIEKWHREALERVVGNAEEQKKVNDEYYAYLDRAERKYYRDSLTNFNSYVDNMKNLTDELAATKRGLLQTSATNARDFGTAYNLSLEGANVTYNETMADLEARSYANRKKLIEAEIKAKKDLLATQTEGTKEYKETESVLNVLNKELAYLTEHQEEYDAEIQKSKEIAYLEYIQACSDAFKEYATSIASATTPLEDYNKAVRNFAEVELDNTSDPTGAMRATRNIMQAYWTASDRQSELKGTTASFLTGMRDRAGKLDYRGKWAYNAAAELIAQGKYSDISDYMIEQMASGLEGDAKTNFIKQMNSVIKDAAKQSEAIAAAEFADVGRAISGGLLDGLQAFDELFSTFEQNEQNHIQNQINKLQDAYNDMKEQMEKRNDQSYDNLTRSQKDAIERQKKMDEDELERMKSQIEDEEALLEEAKRKAFEREKGFKLAEATISGLQASLDAYVAGNKIGGPAVGAVFATMATVFTAAKIAAIAAQEYQASYAQGAYDLPQDQTGVNVHKGEMIIPRPFAETLRSEISGNTSDASSGDIVINVYGATDEVSVESSESDNQKQLDIYLTKRVKTMVARGELDGALQTRYAISKNGRRS